MKPFLYLLSGVLVTPGALLGVYFWLVQTAVREGTRINHFWKALVYLFFQAVETAVWMMYLLPPLFVLWVVLAFLPKYQIVGTTVTSLVATASLIEFFLVWGPIKLEDLFIPALSVVGLSISLWLGWNAIKG